MSLEGRTEVGLNGWGGGGNGGEVLGAEVKATWSLAAEQSGEERNTWVGGDRNTGRHVECQSQGGC